MPRSRTPAGRLPDNAVLLQLTDGYYLPANGPARLPPRPAREAHRERREFSHAKQLHCMHAAADAAAVAAAQV